MKMMVNSRKKLKKLKNDVELKLDYKSISSQDIYGIYLTNKTLRNKYDFPMIGSFVNCFPDYFALFSAPNEFKATDKTCVCWFRFDDLFDTIDGVYQAIIYKNTELLKYYKNRYDGVKYMVMPDYSTYSDYDEHIIKHNIYKSIIVYLWFTFECEKIVFPLMTYGAEYTFDWCFEHIMENSNIVVSLKGVCNGTEKEIFKKALKKFVDSRKPKAILVFATCCDKTVYEMLDYAVKRSVKICIIENAQRKLNLNRHGKK